MEWKDVLYEKDKDNKHIARITLNRPEKLNAFNFIGGEPRDLGRALREAEEDDDIKVVILKAAGRAFCAGHDLSAVGFVYGFGTESGERPSQRVRLRKDRASMGHGDLLFFPKVTIAQVHGYCLGGGMIFATMCDITIAAEDALLGHIEQRLGFAGCGIPTVNLLILQVGLKRARELLLTGRLINGVEAERIGLVNKAVPADKLEEEVNKEAEAITLLPADGIAIGKAFTELAYNSLGVTSGFTHGYIGHSFFTNLRWEPDEYNFFRERREKGTKRGMHGLHERYEPLET